MHDYTDRIMDEESFSFYKESRSDWVVYRALTHNNGYGDEIGIVLIETPQTVFTVCRFCAA
jgi:hypothetical protein